MGLEGGNNLYKYLVYKTTLFVEKILKSQKTLKPQKMSIESHKIIKKFKTFFPG